ncbi:MAG: calcium-translocating P-type ATPase, PMCA-type [Clostridiales bacterium]
MLKHYTGLNDSEVELSRKKHGTNKLAEIEVETFFDKILEAFKDPMIIVLCVALVITFVLTYFGYTEWYEGVGIAFAVFIATVVAAKSEHSSEKSFRKLQEDASKVFVKVYRNNNLANIAIDNLVNNDIVVLQPGDVIPADGVLINGSLKVSQASLTGESKDIGKKPDEKSKFSESFDSEHSLFRGTVVSDGEGVMKVLKVGENTYYGKMYSELQTVERDTPLKIKLGKLADAIAKFGYIGGSFIAIAFMANRAFIQKHLDDYGSDIGLLAADAVTAIILAVIIIVVAVPEGLPMMISIVLSLNMKKLLKENVLVRKLIGIETAGSLNLLFSDKTGTLTVGQLEVVNFVLPGKGKVEINSLSEEYRKIISRSILCNTNASYEKESGDKTCNIEIIGGNMTEKSLLKWVLCNDEIPNEPPEFESLEVTNFDSKKKFMSHKVKIENEDIIYYKGAPEVLLPKITHTIDGKQYDEKQKELMKKEISVMTESAIRVIALAYEKDGCFILIGLLGIRDDIRVETPDAIREAESAGISVVMITGDNLLTAMAISKESGLIKKEILTYNDLQKSKNGDNFKDIDLSKKNVVLTSEELNKLSDDELKSIIKHLKLVARSLPTDKSRLVKVAQSLGLVVGMTGDGVNDAPSLKAADIGFSMGNGTDLAKECSEIVIMDSNLMSIVKSILYGRTIYNNIGKFLTYQLSVNIAAIAIAFLGPFIGVDLPLTMTQLLWVNLVMDTLAALAFGGEPALEKYMLEKPKQREQALISKDMWSFISVGSFLIVAISLIFLLVDGVKEIYSTDEAFKTGFFTLFIFCNIVNMFNLRTNNVNIFKNIKDSKNFLRVAVIIAVVQILLIYLGRNIFQTVPLTVQEIIITAGISIIVMLVPMSIFKLIKSAKTYDVPTSQENNA